MAEKKNPTAVQVGQRIRQARKMAGFDTAAQLLDQIPQWSKSRLGNYEAGISIPSPDDIQLIATHTDASPCWIMFGLGPIRAHGRDIQAIRHQNFTYLVEQCRTEKGSVTVLLKQLGLSKKKLDEQLANPFQEISDRIARRCEKFAGRPSGWLDEQHVQTDPVCAAFPDDMREIMEIYSNLPGDRRVLLLELARVFASTSSK